MYGKNPTDTAPPADPTMTSSHVIIRSDRLQEEAGISKAGLAVSAMLSLLMISVLAICLKRRIQSTTAWTKAPSTTWTIITIYVDSIMFIVWTAILIFGFKVNSNTRTCSSAILLCLLCYMSIKFLYYYLVEKIYITRKLQKPRLKSKLYLFNCFGILFPYSVIIILAVIYRTSSNTPDGACIIGIKSRPLIAFIILDAFLNLYLTLLFVIPLRSICIHSQAHNPFLRTVALRSLLSCLLTLTTTTANLTVLLVLNGEPAWIFLQSCNVDIVLCILIRRWVMLTNSPSTTSSHSPEDIFPNEPNAAASPFSTSRTAQNMDVEQNAPELPGDGNGKVTECEAPSSPSGEKDADGPSSSMAEATGRPTVQNPVSGTEICEGESETMERAIITTHISAQKMHDPDVEKFRSREGGDQGKFGGIHVMIEQVVEVELNMVRLSSAAALG